MVSTEKRSSSLSKSVFFPSDYVYKLAGVGLINVFSFSTFFAVLMNISLSCVFYFATLIANQISLKVMCTIEHLLIADSESPQLNLY